MFWQIGADGQYVPMRLDVVNDVPEVPPGARHQTLESFARRGFTAGVKVLEVLPMEEIERLHKVFASLQRHFEEARCRAGFGEISKEDRVVLEAHRVARWRMCAPRWCARKKAAARAQ